MKGKQAITAVLAMVVYTVAVLALGKQVQIYAEQSHSQLGAAQLASATSGGGCGSESMGAHGCSMGSQPAVVGALLGEQKKATDKAAFAAALKHHKAAVEKANAELAAAVVKLAKIDPKSTKGMECMLHITTGIHTASCGSEAGSGCGAHAPDKSSSLVKPKSGSPKTTL